MNITDIIEDNGYDSDDILIFTNPSYDSAFLGISDDNRAIYDFDKMVEWLMKEDGIEDIEAIEFIEYNTVRTLPYYEKPPIILYPCN